MDLRTWRLTRKNIWSIKRTSEKIEAILGREMQVRTLQRYETGENQTPTDVVEALYFVTRGLVTAGAMHRTRRDYMLSKRMLSCPIWDGNESELALVADGGQ